MLRDKDAPALREALNPEKAVPFSRMLFEREREAVGPLDTPEKQAGLKGNLRKAAAVIADSDLSKAYKEFFSRLLSDPDTSEAERKTAY